MISTLGLVIDVVLFIALGITMFYGLRLSRQFDKLQADRKVFDQLIQALNLASGRAEAAIRSLKEAAMDSGEKLQEKVGVARALSEELEIMVQAGDNLAERLNVLAEKSRKANVPSDGADEQAPATAQPRTRAEKELLEAVKSRQQS